MFEEATPINLFKAPTTIQNPAFADNGYGGATNNLKYNGYTKKGSRNTGVEEGLKKRGLKTMMKRMKRAFHFTMSRTKIVGKGGRFRLTP